MNVIKPTPALSPYVACYTIVEAGGEKANRILPETSLTLAVRYKGSVRFIDEFDERGTHQLSAFSITGLRRSHRMIHYAQGSGTILVQFKPGGAAAFFSGPIYELFDANNPLDCFFNRSELDYWEELVDCANSIADKVKVIEAFLISKLTRRQPDQLVSVALQQIQLANGLLKIGTLAQYLNISTDAFEKRFRKIVGATPKQYAGIVRMKSLIGEARSGRLLPGLALDAGFFDQAHFNRDFKRFSGQTPTEFFRLPPLW